VQLVGFDGGVEEEEENFIKDLERQANWQGLGTLRSVLRGKPTGRAWALFRVE